MGPGSAAHYCVLRCVRGTRLNEWHGLASSRLVLAELRRRADLPIGPRRWYGRAASLGCVIT
jgi:hypothetical protein